MMVKIRVVSFFAWSGRSRREAVRLLEVEREAERDLVGWTESRVPVV